MNCIISKSAMWISKNYVVDH